PLFGPVFRHLPTAQTLETFKVDGSVFWMGNVAYGELQQLWLTVPRHFAIALIYPKQTTGNWIGLSHSNRRDFKGRAELFLAFAQRLLSDFHFRYIRATSDVSEKFSIFREAGNPAGIHPPPLTLAPFHSTLPTAMFPLTPS